MVNASLNWASIVGIVLAVCGGGLYFLRSFKPALARDYDVFFAAIGLLCGGILFFQGWRLDPILQFGQFLLAGTTVFFAYESVRLRGIATDQARRSSFFDEDDLPNMPRNSPRSRWEEDYDQFERPQRPSRRFRSGEEDAYEDSEDNSFRSRRLSRAIPESAASRRRSSPRDLNYNESENLGRRRPVARQTKSTENDDSGLKRNFEQDRGDDEVRSNFGERRSARSDLKRGSRPLANQNRSRNSKEESSKVSSKQDKLNNLRPRSRVRTQQQTNKVEEASYKPKRSNEQKPRQRQVRRSSNQDRESTNNQTGRYSVGSNKARPRDNSSRFDD